MSYLMEPHYDKHYFFMEKYGGKQYVDRDGRVRQFGYTYGGRWNFESVLSKLIELLGRPHSILDIGTGCG